MTRAKRKVPWLLVVGLLSAAVLQLTPAHAAGGVAGSDTGARSGADLIAPSMAGGCGDALDPIATQSRQAQVYQDRNAPTYTGVLDIDSYKFYAGKKLDDTNLDPGWINASIQLCADAPTQPLHIPPGYQDITYYWLFQNITSTGTQNSVQPIGQDCDPLRANDLGPTTEQRISLFRYQAKGPQCAKAASTANEIKAISAGPTPVHEIDLLDSGPYVNRTDDKWFLQINVSFGVEVVGTTAKLVGRWTYGVFEEFSQIYTSIDAVINTSQLSGTVNHGGYVLTGTNCNGKLGTGSFVANSKTVCVRVPYQPRLDAGPDDDLLIDEARTNPILRTGDSVKFAAVHAFGTRLVGLPFPVCPFGPVYPGPGGPAPGYPQSLPGADGGRFCRQGFVGLLTGHDWAPNLGYEGRAVPRSPSWAPGTTANAVQCQYPVGSQTFGVAAAPVTPTMLSSSNEQDNAVFYNNDAFWVSPQYQNNAPVAEFQVPAQNYPAAAIPALTGQNVPCGYQPVITGLHYNPQATTFLA